MLSATPWERSRIFASTVTSFFEDSTARTYAEMITTGLEVANVIKPVDALGVERIRRRSRYDDDD